MEGGGGNGALSSPLEEKRVEIEGKKLELNGGENNKNVFSPQKIGIFITCRGKGVKHVRSRIQPPPPLPDRVKNSIPILKGSDNKITPEKGMKVQAFPRKSILDYLDFLFSKKI